MSSRRIAPGCDGANAGPPSTFISVAMVVLLIHADCLALVPLEHNPKIGPHCNGVLSFSVAFEFMKAKARKPHVFGTGCSIQCRQNPLNLLQGLGVYTFGPTLLPQGLQSFALET